MYSSYIRELYKENLLNKDSVDLGTNLVEDYHLEAIKKFAK